MSRVLTNSAEFGVVDQWDFFDKDIANQSNLEGYFVVEKGDYVYNPRISTTAPVGPISKNNVATGVMSPLYTVFRFNDSHNDFYAYYFKTTGWHQYMRQASSTGARHDRMAIASGDFMAMPLPVASPEEQQKIADCLSSIDELVTLETQKLAAHKAHKKGLMQQLFPAKGETLPTLRFPEFRNAGEWEFTTVGGLVEAGCLFPPKDGNHGNIHPKSSDYVAKGIPFIMASDLNGGRIDIDSCHFISKEQADTLQKGFAKEGDVLLSHKGTVGEVAVVRKINTPYLMLTPQVTYYRVRDRKRLSNEFLAQLFVADEFQSNLAEVSGGGTRAYIGIIEQAKLRLQLPKDVEEQQYIASCLNSLDTLITAQTQKIDTLKAHKKGLMQQLFPTLDEAQE